MGCARRLLVAVVFSSVLLAGCAEQVSEPTPNPTPTPTPPPTSPIGEYCEDIVLAQATGEPGDHIRLTGVPQGTETLVAVVEVMGSSQQGLALVVKDEASIETSPLSLLVPVHPITPLDGGLIQLSFSDGEGTCPASEFTVGPLADTNDTSVDGSFSRSITALQASIEAAASEIGIDIATLQQPLSDLPTEYMSLGMKQYLIDHPSNPNALATLLRRGTVIEGDAEIRVNSRLLDALATNLGLKNLFDKPSLQANQTNPNVKWCIGKRALRSAETLNYCMTYYQTSDTAILYNDLIAEALAYSAIIASANPAIGDEVAFAAIANVLFAHGIILTVEQQLLPSALTSLDFRVDRDTFTNSDQVGQWHDVRVSVADTEGINTVSLINDFFNKLIGGKILMNIKEPSARLQLFQKLVEDTTASVTKWITEETGKDRIGPILYSSFPPGRY